MAAHYVTAFLLTVYLYVGLTYAWHLLSGYTGYLSFGQVTFFGLGSYTAALLIIHWGVPWPLASLLSGAIVLPLAYGLGWVMLRLRGPFFAIGMLGCAQIAQRLISMWAPVTHGGEGLYLPPINSLLGVYYAMGAVALGMLLLTHALHGAPFGLRLRSIRDAEEAAEALGVDTTRYKITTFAVASCVPAILGGMDAWYLSYINPSAVFSPGVDLQTVAMGVLGGLGTVWGPLVGSVVLSFVSEVLWAQFPQLHLGLLGAVVAVTVLFFRRGLVPVIGEWWRLWEGRRRVA